MAIESTVMFHKISRIACLVLLVGLVASAAAVAQLPISITPGNPPQVTSGSVIPFNHGGSGIWKQIYSLKVDHFGSIVFLDSAASELYQIAVGSNSPQLVAAPAPTNGHSDCSDLEASGTYWNAAVAFDQWNNLYVTDRYGSATFCRVPYNATAGTWNFANTDIWANAPTYKGSNGTSSPIPPQDVQVGDDGTFFVSTSSTQSIYKFTVDQSGTTTSVTPVATGLEDMVSNLAVDHAGNLFFIENAYDSPTNRVNGIREIPANMTLPITGDGTGTAESKLLRVDPAGAGFNGIKGMTFDTLGNLYWSSENNTGYGGQVDGVFMTPNEGTPTAPNLVFADSIMVSPVPAGFPVLIDPRGLMWIPTGGNSNWAPSGSIAPNCDQTSTKTVDATCLESSMVLWKPGSVTLGSSAVNTPGTAQPIFYMFNQATTAKFNLAGPNAGSFVRSANPIADPNATNPVLPCADNQAYPAFNAVETNPAQYSWCGYYPALKATAAGNISAEVQLLNGSNIVTGSNSYVNGTGLAPAASVIFAPAVQPLATGLNDPLQVAADSAGNTYVADSALKAIEKYPAGTTSPASGKALGTGLTAPTGVAVDGAGDLYIGDSGKVIEIPYVNGALVTASQTTIASGLGNHLNLAADGAGNVYVADKDNKKVVAVPNPLTGLLRSGLPALTLGSGFTSPSAIATDSAGNVWLADGTNLWEILMPYGAPTEVLANGLQAPVTGLAIDPSGSVFVAEASGLVWIPYNSATGSLNVNGQVLVAAGLGTSNSSLPYGVALDAYQNAYATYGSGTSAGAAQLGIAGSLNFNDFGEINPNVPFEVDAQIFNLGNVNLTVANDATNDVISGAAASDYTVGPATLNSPACSATTNTVPGGSCFLGLVVTAPTPGQANALIAVKNNGANAITGLNIAMASNVIQDPRPASSVVLVLTPSSGIVYPGSLSVKATVSSGASFGTPTGTVVLSVSSSNGSLPKQTKTLDSSGSATFTYTSLLGGSYTINALYGGAGTGGATQNTCTPAGQLCFAGNAAKTTFAVTPAAPTFSVGQPGNAGCLTEGTASTDPCTPNQDNLTVWAGNTYVNAGTTVWLTASATSKVGTPTGTVTFMQNGKPVDPTQGVNGAIPLTALTLSNKTVVQGVQFNTQNLAQGVYNLTAVFSGDVNYGTQSVNLPTFEIISPSVQVTSTGTVSVKAGTPTQATLTLMPLVGYSGDVHLECNAPDAPIQLAPTTPSTMLPSYTQCTFAYANSVTGTTPVGKTGPTASTIVVTISTNVPVNGGSASIERKVPWVLAVFFGFGTLGLFAGRRRFNRYLALICMALMFSGLFMGISACTNAGYSTPPPAPKVTTPAGTYNVQIITYNQGSLQQSSLTTPMFTLPITVQ